MTGPSYKKFRNQYLENFGYINGFVFKASEFANVTGNWPISFTIWKSNYKSYINEFVCNIVESQNGEIHNIGNKSFYNLDNIESMASWYRKDFIKKSKKIIKNYNGPLNIKDGNIKVMDDFIGYFYSESNNVYKSVSFCNLWSLPANGHGVSITPNNFNECITAYATRKNVLATFLNAKDEFMIPNIIHKNWNEYVNDSIIYSLFQTNAYFTSLKFDGKLYKNEFFWMSKSEIEDLANTYNNDDCYADVHTSDDRFVYKKLQEITLTPEAQAVLDKACEIVRKTFKYRQLFNEEHPEVQINNWDAGFYQIKALAKEYAKDDLEEFKKLYNALADKMRPMVYELGFLK